MLVNFIYFVLYSCTVYLGLYFYTEVRNFYSYLGEFFTSLYKVEIEVKSLFINGLSAGQDTLKSRLHDIGKKL